MVIFEKNVDSQLNYDDVAPDASAMIESMRAHGYTLATAIADLIDNSISARCRNVWLRFEWQGNDSWISITDDGYGMTEEKLVNAMRLGSQNPLDRRDTSDLGRFGLGLKTASFSQARRLTVISRPDPGDTFLRRWDLDHLARAEVQGWQLLRAAHPASGDRVQLLDSMGLKRGTQVLLEEIDRVTGETSRNERQIDREDHFLWQIQLVQQQLAMVFHSFLTKKKNGLRIFLNDEPIQPWDPFLEKHKATQLIGEYSENFGNHEMPVRVKGFVLPHRDRFDNADAHRASGGPNGWNAQQGFYLYRGERLIIAGDWLQLKWQKEEHFKLARIRIDISNSMDHEWQIDVKKSAAIPPRAVRGWLRSIAQEVRKVAKEVYAHRGNYGSRRRRPQFHDRPWVTDKKPDGTFSYQIDRKHPVLEPLIRSLSESKRQELETLLRLIEETVPVQRIWIDTADNQDGVALPFAGERGTKLRRIIELCHGTKMRHDDIDADAAWDVLVAFAGFQGSEAQAIIAELREGDD